jgi:hypothetical protein
MNKKIFNLSLFLSIFVSFSLCIFAQGGKDLEIINETNKVALVIGNANYQNGFSALNSPKKDAYGVGESLKRLGFSLIGGKAHIDLTYQEMEKLINQFTFAIKNGGVGLFYFSGHGSQNNKRNNYLIPIDKNITFLEDLALNAISVEEITGKMEESKNKLNILILDACRNNPLPIRSKSASNINLPNKGLNSLDTVPASGLYIAFAARDGQTASDGCKNCYSLYTEKLLQFIELPNQTLEDMFKRTRVAVKVESENRQYPIDYGSVDGFFYFKPKNNTVLNTIIPALNDQQSSTQSTESQEKPKAKIYESESCGFSFQIENGCQLNSAGNLRCKFTVESAQSKYFRLYPKSSSIFINSLGAFSGTEASIGNQAGNSPSINFVGGTSLFGYVNFGNFSSITSLKQLVFYFQSGHTGCKVEFSDIPVIQN